MKSRLLCFFTSLIPLLISAKNPQGIVEGNNKFAFKLYNELKSDKEKNLFYSPFSISTALAMTYAGARDSTALQMRQTMNFPKGEKFHTGFKNLMEGLAGGAGSRIKLNIANGLWAQQDFRFLDSYIELVKANYNAEIRNVDFNDAGAREIAQKEINGWVEKQTNDKIKDLLTPADLGSLTRLVLVNAIYFYGEWASPFKKAETTPMDFFPLDEREIRVPFMNQHGRFNYYEDKDIKALELPYRDNKASMIIFLPNSKAGITKFEKSFDYKYYMDVVGSFQAGYVNISLPKFQASYRIYLSNTLSKMGMPLAFSSGGADFSGMTGKRDLFISKVIHQAFVSVDELGTEAAAATAVIMALTAMPPSPDAKFFIADHPFIFLIKDNTTGSILFIGKIMNPGIPL